MDKLSFHPLEPLRFPLVNRFYKQHYPAGKAKKDEIIWTGEDNKQICCCVRFKLFDGFQLLTGMVVAPERRGTGIGRQLLHASRPQQTLQPCYCLAFSYLEQFYESADFSRIGDHDLPEALLSRLVRYRAAGKDLIAMKL
ncbi:acyltransferase [Photobacterium aquae]|uniref:Acyltransferase n=1 Tax=Photobacterium aquae TaxID=1195763 RepID=A0A0J1GJ53_9GAMM|nr:GNAT family N-acetyltransferase [Photobacterium aquae]KLU99600.1 acyltransferase [Photobacterium aquae]